MIPGSVQAGGRLEGIGKLASVPEMAVGQGNGDQGIRVRGSSLLPVI